MSDAIVRDGQTARAWYQPTTGKFLFALFAIEIALYASEQYRWFEFNRHKNWTVLVNAAVVAVGLLLVFLWVVGAALFKRRRQFGLSTMMGLVLVVGLACGWLSREIANTRSRPETIKKLAELGVMYVLNFSRTSSTPTETLRSEGVQVLGVGLSVQFSTDADTLPLVRKWLGDDLFSTMDDVTFSPNNEDEVPRGMEALKSISDLKELHMLGPHITDATLSRLGELPGLESLTISGASISNDGLRHLLLQKNLHSIQLDGVVIDDAGLTHLKELKHLSQICVRRTPITDVAIARMADMKMLTLVHVEDTLVTDEGASHLQSELPKCCIMVVRGGKIKTMNAARR